MLPSKILSRACDYIFLLEQLDFVSVSGDIILRLSRLLITFYTHIFLKLGITMRLFLLCAVACCITSMWAAGLEKHFLFQPDRVEGPWDDEVNERKIVDTCGKYFLRVS